MSVDGSRDHMIDLQGWPKDAPPFSFSEADLGWESEEKKAEAASRAWDKTWVGNDEEQQLELEEEEESDRSVRPFEDDSDDESEDDGEFLDLATGLTRTEGHPIQGHTLDTPMRTLNS